MSHVHVPVKSEIPFKAPAICSCTSQSSDAMVTHKALVVFDLILLGDQYLYSSAFQMIEQSFSHEKPENTCTFSFSILLWLRDAFRCTLKYVNTFQCFLNLCKHYNNLVRGQIMARWQYTDLPIRKANRTSKYLGERCAEASVYINSRVCQPCYETLTSGLVSESTRDYHFRLLRKKTFTVTGLQTNI